MTALVQSIILSLNLLWLKFSLNMCGLPLVSVNTTNSPFPLSNPPDYHFICHSFSHIFKGKFEVCRDRAWHLFVMHVHVLLKKYTIRPLYQCVFVEWHHDVSFLFYSFSKASGSKSHSAEKLSCVSQSLNFTTFLRNSPPSKYFLFIITALPAKPFYAPTWQSRAEQ